MRTKLEWARFAERLAHNPGSATVRHDKPIMQRTFRSEPDFERALLLPLHSPPLSSRFQTRFRGMSISKHEDRNPLWRRRTKSEISLSSAYGSTRNTCFCADAIAFDTAWYPSNTPPAGIKAPCTSAGSRNSSFARTMSIVWAIRCAVFSLDLFRFAQSK